MPPPRLPILRARREVLAALLAAAGAGALPRTAAALPPVALRFPRDLGAHPDFRTEWWYITGHATAGGRPFGFQLTFFRSRIAGTQALASRLAARQLLFAHAALTDLQSRRLLHDQRIARWNGTAATGGPAEAATDDMRVRIGDWSLARGSDGLYRARLPADGFALELDFAETQPLLLQGDAGLSRKGPEARQASYYYSLPLLAPRGALVLDGRRFALDAPSPRTGAAWFDHEWSDELLATGAVGWDWIGINLFDGSTLTAFRLRSRDGGTVWTGGSWRPAGGAVQVFGNGDVAFVPGRRWTSPHTGAAYPVEWQVRTPAGRFVLAALQDDQELDSRSSTGAVYWEGVSDLRASDGTPVGRGYLEMTGYLETLRL